jgi:hydrogenase maturation protease
MYGDDGVGYCVARALKLCISTKFDVEPRQTISLGDAALLLNRDLVVIIDAAIGIEDVEVYEVGREGGPPLRLEDSHSVDPLRLVEVASAAGFNGRVLLVLVPVKSTEFGAGISVEALQNALKAILITCSLVGVGECPLDCIKERMGDCLGEPLLD